MPGKESDGMSDNENAGGDAGTSEQPTGSSKGGGSAPDLSGELTNERSANKIIKDLARERNMTVSQLVDAFKATEDANKSELQRALEQVKDLDGKYRESVTELQKERAEKAIRDAAATAGARADRLGPIFRAVRDEITYGDDGKPTNVTALIDQARSDMPEFFQRVSGSGDGGKGTGDTGTDPNAAMNELLRRGATRT